MMEESKPRLIDEAMLTVEEIVGELFGPLDQIIDHDEQVIFSFERCELDFPIQLDIVVEASGKIQMGTTPPLYTTETSFMPVFHQLKFTIEKVD